MNSIQSSSIPLGFCAILIVSGFIAVTKGELPSESENATRDEFRSVADFVTDPKGRSRRSLFDRMPSKLKIQIPTVTGKVTHITWYKKEHHLANKHLPVFISSQSSSSDVLRDFGEFVVYRDVGKCSVAVYFEKSHSLSGLVGLDYYLVNIPYNFDRAGKYPRILEESYIRFEGDGSVHNNSLFSYLSQILPDTLDDDAGPSHKRQRVERNLNPTSHKYERNTNESIIRTIRTPPSHGAYYLEILIFITSDVAQVYKNSHGDSEIYIKELVKGQIIYFSAIDMLFQKLALVHNLYMNIAKIVIEDVLKPFDFTSEHEIEFSATVEKLRRHLHHNHRFYSPDSYDHVFIMTNRPIMAEGIYVSGKTTPNPNIYETRKIDKYNNGAAITLLGYSQPYVLAAHEISKTFNVETDSWIDRLSIDGKCNSIMQEGSSRCEKCLKWSHQSRLKFLDFFRNNRNRCFLMNPPRSLLPETRPSYELYPYRLCQCFGYEFYLPPSIGLPATYVGAHNCDSLLECQSSNGGELVKETTVYTLDGTRCDDEKVCWNRVCSIYKPIPNH